MLSDVSMAKFDLPPGLCFGVIWTSEEPEKDTGIPTTAIAIPTGPSSLRPDSYEAAELRRFEPAREEKQKL